MSWNSLVAKDNHLLRSHQDSPLSANQCYLLWHQPIKQGGLSLLSIVYPRSMHLAVLTNSLKYVRAFQIEFEFVLVFKERGKLKDPEKNLSELRKEPTTNSAYIWCRRRGLNSGHIGGWRVMCCLQCAILVPPLGRC